MKKRSLSEFMCMEMLYDYKSDKLDALRSQAVEECLSSSPRVRDELKKLTLGMNYCDKLKEIKVSLPLIEAISSQPKPTEKLISKLGFTQLPQPVKWGLEAVVVAVAIALFVTQVPELFKGQEDSLVVRKIETSNDIEVEQKEESIDVDQSHIAQQSAETKVAVNPPEAPKVKESVLVEDKVVKPDVMAVATPGSQTSAPLPESIVVKPVKKQGYVYRLVMFVDNVDEVTPQIVQLLETNGGKKAGEVELGWRRKGGSYFHFTIPKQNYGLVTEELKKYSDFNIVKSDHPRVMPEGVERFILWVEERKQ